MARERKGQTVLDAQYRVGSFLLAVLVCRWENSEDLTSL